MDIEAQKRGQERIRRLRIPERFRDYAIALIELPQHPDYDLIYDMPARTIWVNASARPGANIIRLETNK